MAASLITLTGHLNAASKSNPAHPFPKLYGSATARFLMTTPGYPIDAAPYFQSFASLLTPATICLAVSLGPDENSRNCFCPVARIFTCVPPISTTRIFNSSSLCQACALGSDNLHQIVPGTNERFGSVILELCAQLINVDASRRELVQQCFAIAAVGGHGYA